MTAIRFPSRFSAARKRSSCRSLKLAGALRAQTLAFLGILPIRDDPELGVEIRFVYPNSAAAVAGLQPGDRITKLGPATGPLQPLTGGDISGRDQLANLLNTLTPGTELKLEVVRKQVKTETLTVKLGELPENVPDKLPTAASREKALEPRKTAGPQPPKKEEPKEENKKEDKKDAKKKVETGLLSRLNAAKDHKYWIYVPGDYDPNISYALVIWLHPVGKGKEKDVKQFCDTWDDYCYWNHIILAIPKAENDTGWVASETDIIRQAAKDVLDNYTIDQRRIVAHGMGIGGQMAFYAGFHARDLIRGVATTGAPLVNPPKENLPSQTLAFFIVAGGKDPLKEAIEESKKQLAARKFPVVFREVPDMGTQYLDEKTLEELIRWIDSLDGM